MNRMRVPSDAPPIKAADPLRLRRGGRRSVGDAGLPLPRPRPESLTESAPERNGEDGRQKSKDSSDRAPRHRLSPARSGHPAPPPTEESVPHVASSRLCPAILPLALERVESSYRFLHLLDVLEVCDGLRKVLSRSRGDLDPDLAVLIGESAKGRPSIEPKVAFVPFASVGHPQAYGRLLAMGLALPKNTTPTQRRHLSAALERIPKEGIALGRFGTWRLEPHAEGALPHSLLPEFWTGHPNGATDWATVTPIVLGGEVTESTAFYTKTDRTIRLACRHEGLPEPCEIIVTPVSAHFGTPPADAFPCFQQQGTKRHHRHAILIFPEPVCGPILLGAGRHLGYGLCRPMAETVDG
jgi:CRISPR-associated protein Csb2